MLRSDIRLAEATAAARADSADVRARLLCVDDSAAVRKEVQDLLQDHYDIVLAGNGIEGLRAAKASFPDVVLCDSEMPELNGLQMLLAMKSDPALKPIPFIVFTSNAQQTASRFLNAGAEDFLSKPFTAEELRARVGAAVRTFRAHRQLRAEHQNLTRLLTRLAQSEARTRAVIESALDGILLLGEDGKIVGLNGSAEGMFGWSRSEATGRAFLEELVASRSRSALAERLARPGSRAAPASPTTRWEIYGLRRDGQEFPIECHFTRIEASARAAVCAFVRDLTETQRLQMELEQAQKLEAVGRLASSAVGVT